MTEYQSRVVDYCKSCRTPMGPWGCRRCQSQPVPMPAWFKRRMVELGLREPPVSETGENDNNTDRNPRGTA